MRKDTPLNKYVTISGAVWQEERYMKIAEGEGNVLGVFFFLFFGECLYEVAVVCFCNYIAILLYTHRKILYNETWNC